MMDLPRDPQADKPGRRPSGPSPNRVDRLFASMCVIGALAILSSTMSKSPVLPRFAKSLGAQGPELGIIAAASTVPGVLVSLPAGSLSDLFGRRRVILFSLVIFATAPFLYLPVRKAWQLIAVRFYHGFATAIFVPVASAAIAERYPGRRGERISAFSSATRVGRGVAPFLGGAILYVTASFRSVYLAVGVSALAALLVWLGTSRDVGGPRGERSARISIVAAWRLVAGNVGILTASLVEASQYFVYGAFEFFIVLYAGSVGLDDLRTALVLGAWLVTIMATQPLFGWASDRAGRRPVILGGMVLGGVPLALTPLARGFAPLLMASVAQGLGFSAVVSSTPAYVADLTAREAYGSALGFLSTIMDVGQTLGPMVTAAVVAGLGYASAFASLGLLLFAVSPIFLLSTGLRLRKGP